MPASCVHTTTRHGGLSDADSLSLHPFRRFDCGSNRAKAGDASAVAIPVAEPPLPGGDPSIGHGRCSDMAAAGTVAGMGAGIIALCSGDTSVPGTPDLIPCVPGTPYLIPRRSGRVRVTSSY
jgi:hypothetical protein